MISIDIIEVDWYFEITTNEFTLCTFVEIRSLGRDVDWIPSTGVVILEISVIPRYGQKSQIDRTAVVERRLEPRLVRRYLPRQRQAFLLHHFGVHFLDVHRLSVATRIGSIGRMKRWRRKWRVGLSLFRFRWSQHRRLARNTQRRS